MNKQAHELEEKLTLLENNEYPKALGKIMLRDVFEILGKYSEPDYEKQMGRYLMLEVKYR